jgi:hypothetical protein
MNFKELTVLTAVGVVALSGKSSACTPIKSVTCYSISTPPSLDGNTDDWSAVEPFVVPLTGALSSAAYPRGDGNVKIHCSHDSEKIYFLFEVPGPYRFDREDNHLCASISTMFRMGEDATLVNMGGCPLAGNCEAAPEGCDPYKVDLGGHWELKGTEMSVAYGTNEGTGDDAIANKDDEYAVAAQCRFDDDDAKAANEWEGAWLHTSPVKIERDAAEEGFYVFEMARSLQTASDETDAQLEPGTSIDFGFAFWDPYETEESGWTDAGHYVTGCSKDWILLRILNEDGIVDEDPSEDATGDEDKKEELNGTEVTEGTSASAASLAGSGITLSLILASVLKSLLA